MEALSNAKSRRLYSWWWDSHISPKNSKWLKENLTDMDAKVKLMIKLIEEDADSFARRAEMYYKKRPELMKMVEEFYRAYRALAERYDNATGVIRQAHHTMIEAFPNQHPFAQGDDSPFSSTVSDGDPHTPEMPFPIRPSFDFDESNFQKKNGSFEGRVKKSLDFSNTNEKKQEHVQNDDKFEKEIGILKETVAKLEAEKDNGLLQYQQSLEKLSDLQREIDRAQEESRELDERASKAKAAVQNLKEELTKSEAEREASILQYQQCLDKISDLEKNISLSQENFAELNERNNKVETEAQSLKHDLSMVEAEKETLHVQNNELLIKVSDLEKKLLQAEEHTRRINEQADESEKEVATLKKALANLTEEKEAIALQYEQCLLTISFLEHQISCAQQEAERLNSEISDGVLQIKSAEARCSEIETSNQSLQAEIESLVHKMGTQDQELIQKQQEVGKLMSSVQEERSRFMEVESAFMALQNLHSQSQEELKSLAIELQQRAEILNELKIKKNELQNEVYKVKEENSSLNEKNLSSTLSIKDMQEELVSLRKEREKLENEVELRGDQREVFQQEIHCLKEEIADLNKKHSTVLQQVESVGLNSDSFGSAVKELQNEISELNETCHKERIEKETLFEKLKIMDKLIEKNSELEKSISNLSAELEAMRVKVKELEDACQFYLGEKSVLIAEKANTFSQLQVTTENYGKLLEKNVVLENSLSGANSELEVLKEKLKRFEDSCQLLGTENSFLLIEKESLHSQIQISQQNLDDLEKKYVDLEEKCTDMEKKNESTICEVEELRVLLDVEKKEHAENIQIGAIRLADLESQLILLQEESERRKKDLEKELDEAVNAQIEIFILQKCVKDLENENVSLLDHCERLSYESDQSQQHISELEKEKVQQEVSLKSFFDQINKIRTWMNSVLKALEIDSYRECDYTIEQDQKTMDLILCNIEDKVSSLLETLDENQKLILENLVLSTLIEHLKLDALNLETEKNAHYQELKTRSMELLALKNDYQSQEEENYDISGQLISLNYLSLIFKNTIMEKFEEMKMLGQNLDETRSVNCLMEEKLNIIHENLEITGLENHHLKESLQKSDNDLKTIQNVCNQLYIEIASSKETFHKKELELLEAEKKLDAAQNEQIELQNQMEDMKREFDEVKLIKEDQEKQIHNLSLKSDDQNTEIESLHGTNQTLEVKLLTLEQEHIELQVKEKILISQSEKWRNEAKLWETEGIALFNELQISSIYKELFAEKIHELTETCKSLEDQSTSYCMEIEILKEKIGALDDKNEELETQFSACIPAVNSLEHAITSLENYTFQHFEVDKLENEKVIKDNLEIQTESCTERNENLDSKLVQAGFPNIHGLESRIKDIERAYIEMERLAEIQKLNNTTEIKADTSNNNSKTQKTIHEISEEGSETLTKDIMLDQVSESSPSPYVISRREPIKTTNDHQMLEVWETNHQHNSSFDLKVEKTRKSVPETTSYHQVKASERENSRNPESEIMAEKDSLSVDKLKISRRFTEPRQEGGNKRNILERLASDAQKLTNLQITVQDLKRKVEITEKGKKGNEIEYSSVKEQLEESEDTISKLFDINKKLRNSAKEYAFSSEEKYDADSEENGNIKRRRVSEQARKGSEKIGRLQLEVQKLQFLLLKLDDGKKSEGKTRTTERRTRVLLRDYLYGLRSSQKGKKKATFCACVRPPTKGD